MNVRRSGPQSEYITISVDMDTPLEKLNDLHVFINQWIKDSESREFEPGGQVRINEIYDIKRMDISVEFKHKGNWQSGINRFARRTRMIGKIREGLLACGIGLAEKPLRVLGES